MPHKGLLMPHKGIQIFFFPLGIREPLKGFKGGGCVGPHHSLFLSAAAPSSFLWLVSRAGGAGELLESGTRGPST